MRVSGILPELAEQLGYASAERRHLPLELCHPLETRGQLRVPSCKSGFQLRDSLVPPIVGHEASNRPSAPAWKVKILDHLRGP
jgi:hypothetical protein